VPAWSRMRGHALVREERQAGDDDQPVWALTVRLGPRRML
jgi:hypothetical protein